MLDKMRESAKGVVSWGIVLLIGVTFALWGVSDYFTGGRKNNLAAVVNGEKIPWKSIDLLYDRMQPQFANAAIDPRMIKEQLRVALIQRTALISSVRELGFRVSDNNIAEAILKIPAFQVDGKFSKERYLEVLGKAAYTDVGFRRELEQDVLIGQLEQGLVESSFSLPTEIARILTLFDQRRDFGYALIPHDKYHANIKVTQQEIQSHYDKFRTNFVSPEQASIEYVVLSMDQLAKQEVVTDDELKAYYDEHVASYSAPERVNARHILITVPRNGDAEADKAALQKAESLIAKIKNGEEFGSLAKAHSDDKGSAIRDGELGWFVRGQMVPEFEKATFDLNKPKELAGPIRTQFGYHIIELIEKRPAETRPFTEVRDLVLEQVQKEKAQITFAEKSEKMATLAFENKNSLQPLADALGLKIVESTSFDRQGNSIQAKKTDIKKSVGEGEAKETKEAKESNGQATQESTLSTNAGNNDADQLIKNPLIITAAFSDEVLNEKTNSEPIQLGESTTVILRIKNHQAAEQQKLEDVQKIIEERLINEQAKVKVKNLAESLQKRLREGEDAITLAKENDLEWVSKTSVTRQGSGTTINKNIVSAVFQMPYRLQDEKKHSAKAVPLLGGDYAIVVLDKVIPGDVNKVDARIQNAYRQNLSEGIAQLEFSLYTTDTVNQAKVELADQQPAG